MFYGWGTVGGMLGYYGGRTPCSRVKLLHGIRVRFLEGVEHSVRDYGTVGLCYCRGKVRVL